MEFLEARGLDIELCSKLGLGSHFAPGGGESILIPTAHKGEVIRRKYRLLDRKEGQPKFIQDPGGQQLPFNLDCLYDDTLKDRALVVTEGEMDCIAALQCGFARSISVPNGSAGGTGESDRAFAWIDQLEPWLKLDRVPEVIIASDGDDAGAHLLQELSSRLGRARCRFLTYPKARDAEALGRERTKDLGEVLQLYSAKGVAQTIERAQWVRAEGVFQLSELPPLPESVVYDACMGEAMAEHLKVRLGDLSVWTGIGGFGKSSFLNDLGCRLAKEYGIRIAWASFEQQAQRDHRRALREWYAEDYERSLSHDQLREADAWINHHHLFLIASEDTDASLAWMLEVMELAVVRHGVKMVVIDPWNELEHDRLSSESETEYCNRAIRELKRFAKRFQVHIALVAHPVKQQRLENGKYACPGLYDIAGSAAFRNKADLGLVLHKTDEDTSILKCEKSRYWEFCRPGIVKLAYCKQTRRFTVTERDVADLGEERLRRRRQ
jgi:twinkle protein